jgi:hypothetical protein
MSPDTVLLLVSKQCVIVSEFDAINYNFNCANKKEKEKEDRLFYWISLF